MTDAIEKFDGAYRFLSNFYPSPIKMGIRGVQREFPTVEHAFQGAKVLASDWSHDNADAWLDSFVRVPSPVDAKSAGKKIPIDIARWDQISLIVMHRALKAKFDQHSDLRQRLLATGDAILIEGNTWGDTKWGVCRGRGLNLLGKTLMEVRGEFRDLQ